MDTINRQKQHIFEYGSPNIEERRRLLNQLYDLIRDNEIPIKAALKEDLNKPETEAYFTEILILFNEIRYALKNLRRWASIKKVKSPLLFFPAKSYIQPEPMGTVLIIAPWNFPFHLTISPLIGALAAGNRAVLKPSEFSPATELLIAELIPKYFKPHEVSVVCGGPEITQQLIDAKPDLIFFTGSTATGSKIMEYAAKHVIPVILELGGKSPCIVDRSTDLSVAARRIAWGKFTNAGQTCIAPDHVFVHEQISKEFIELLCKEIDQMFPLEPDRYCKIINKRHFDRIVKMLNGPIVKGGQLDEKKLIIEPTLILNPPKNHPSIQEEIFGPVLPIFTYDHFESLIKYYQTKEKPLAFYLFTNDRNKIEIAKRLISTGGLAINDIIMHIGNGYLPFGGVGQSGFGAYHGKFGFDAFTHYKSIFHKSTFLDLKYRYPPFNKVIKSLEKIVLKISH